jgi:phage/conjugal plasmid C-4 type zinc finger TraR family protein
MDVFDQAQANDELFRRAALSRHFAGQRTPHERPMSGRSAIGAGPGIGRRVCRDCGEEIEPARLKALPFAVRCLGCQTKTERRERHG